MEGNFPSSCFPFDNFRKQNLQRLKIKYYKILKNEIPLPCIELEQRVLHYKAFKFTHKTSFKKLQNIVKQEENESSKKYHKTFLNKNFFSKEAINVY
jgi:hypothetical protein